MNYKKKYQQWLEFDIDTYNELLNIKDEKEIEDRFYKDLTFGTGGLRGLIGAGSNRMNTYTIKRVTYGLSQYVLSKNDEKPSVVIAYDTRNYSREFALAAATIFSAVGIKVYIFKDVAPTPILSYAVRHFRTNIGIVITASHNPKEYNGYKVYNHNGGQLIPNEADEVISFINKITTFSSVPYTDFSKAEKSEMINWIGNELFETFIQKATKQSLYKANKKDLKIIYTPLHGSGNIPVQMILKDFSLSIVGEQELPDGNFPTVHSPNPEERDTLTLAIEQAKKEDADIVIGTDPDCDRIGVAVKNKNHYELLTGNQIGALLVNFVLSHKKINGKSTLIKTIVTNDLGSKIALNKGLNVLNTLTGFKYIGEKITDFEQNNLYDFVIGYEESYGYLVGTHSRDKDAIVAALLICEMASECKDKGITLIDQLEKIYAQYGYYLDALDSFVLEGKDGNSKIERIMSQFRNDKKLFMPNIKETLDYNEGIQNLPKENVLKFILLDDSWIAIRPSGTEPKLKIYYSIKGKNKNEAQEKLEDIRSKLIDVIES